MGSSCFNPSYIYQTPSGYIFRLRVPDDIKPLVGRVEFRYSLRAGALRVAKYRARCIASFIQQLFEKVRERMTEYTPERIIELVKKGVEEVIYDPAGVEVSTQINIDGKTAIQPSYLQKSNDRIVLSSERIKQLTIQYLRDSLANDEKCRALTGEGTESLDGMTFIVSGDLIMFLERRFENA